MIIKRSCLQGLRSAPPSKKYGTESDKDMRRSMLEKQRVCASRYSKMLFKIHDLIPLPNYMLTLTFGKGMRSSYSTSSRELYVTLLILSWNDQKLNTNEVKFNLYTTMVAVSD